jgi:hypothetical protein
LELQNIEKPYSYTASQIRLLFTEDSFDWDVFPAFNEHEFTVYKNKKAFDAFKAQGIPFDGSCWMYRVLSFEGDEVIQSLLKLVHPSPLHVEYDPRSRTSTRWFVTSARTLRKIQMLFHIMGLREMLTVSQVIAPAESEVAE